VSRAIPGTGARFSTSYTGPSIPEAKKMEVGLSAYYFGFIMRFAVAMFIAGSIYTMYGGLGWS
jgi:hypothetical protein